jgi:hypothetical protein
VGRACEPDGVPQVAERLVATMDDAAGMRAARAHALDVYRRHFSKRLINDRWAALLARYANR